MVHGAMAPARADIELIARSPYVGGSTRNYRGVAVTPLYAPRNASLEAIVSTFLGVWRAYRMLFHGDATFEERQSAVEREFAGHALVGKIIDFIRSSGHRALMMSERSGTTADSADAADAGS